MTPPPHSHVLAAFPRALSICPVAAASAFFLVVCSLAFSSFPRLPPLLASCCAFWSAVSFSRRFGVFDLRSRFLAGSPDPSSPLFFPRRGARSAGTRSARPIQPPAGVAPHAPARARTCLWSAHALSNLPPLSAAAPYRSFVYIFHPPFLRALSFAFGSR